MKAMYGMSDAATAFRVSQAITLGMLLCAGLALGRHAGYAKPLLTGVAMFGVFEFVAEAYKHKDENGKLKVKPIVGCEFYITTDRLRKTFSKDEKDPRHHQILLAKNEKGYRNLVKLTSLGFIEGMYSKYPRIDKELILKYHEGLIATTCCLGALVPQAILRKSEEQAEHEFKWWLDLFGEDYYVELQRHG